MNPVDSTEVKVARLEALLKRIQVNAQVLRTERANGEAIAAPVSFTPSSDPTSGSPLTAPTGTVPPRAAQGTLPDFPEQTRAAAEISSPLYSLELPSTELESIEPGAPLLDLDEPVTQIPGPPVHLEQLRDPFEPVRADAAVPLDSLESDLPTLPPSRDDDFEDPNTEHTKPLWLGLDNTTGTFKSEGGVESRPGDSHRTLAETPAAKVGTPAHTDETAALDDSTLERFPSERATSNDELELEPLVDVTSFETSTAQFETGVGEEEHLDTNPPISGQRASSRPQLTSGLAPEELEQELDMSPTFVDDSGGRISEAPPSVLGATINLPEESTDVALELLEPPASSLRSSQPVPDDELEAELPRTSFRAEYDASLSAPPTAVEELRAHDRAEQERRANEGRPSLAAERVAIGRVTDDDLPPVLSSRPAAPSGVGSVVYAPAKDAVGAVFEGERPALRGMGFLELLDASLAIDAR